MKGFVVVRFVMSALFALVGFAFVPLSGTATAQVAPALAIVSPTNGATIDTDAVLVQVDVSDFTISCAQSGAADEDGTGQILAFLDGATIAQLTNIYCTTSFLVPTDGLTAGEHQLAVVLASNTHVPNMDTAQSVTFDYQPAQPRPLPVANFTGDPGVTLVSPLDGATVPAVFDVQVHPQNFFPTTALEGKTNVPGYGHYHVWVDADMSSLAGLVLMPGTNAFTLDLSAWGPGEHHIEIDTAQNDHTMYDPSTSAKFTVTVSDQETAPATPATATSTVIPTVAPTTAPAGTVASIDKPLPTPDRSPAAITVEMTDALRFSPEHLTIHTGQTVTWVNASAMPHSATDDESLNPAADVHPEFAQLPDGAEAWSSGILQPGDSWSYTFTVAGDYSYFCIPHALSGMLGTITVEN
ncbi:MAG TPA: plastocyanin/azurin family copper-binding protein [Thermomicrobiales bacterium]|nr:plastocyanin/azurin family copper-binding protein [Thermomicrobiales bacterium]